MPNSKEVTRFFKILRANPRKGWRISRDGDIRLHTRMQYSDGNKGMHPVMFCPLTFASYMWNGEKLRVNEHAQAAKVLELKANDGISLMNAADGYTEPLPKTRAFVNYKTLRRQLISNLGIKLGA